jgi:hypothetical protein
MEKTIELLLEHLFPKDDPREDTTQQKETRRQTDLSKNTADEEFTQDEVRQILQGFKDRKAPGPNGITNEIIKMVFKTIPKTMTPVQRMSQKKDTFLTNGSQQTS